MYTHPEPEAGYLMRRVGASWEVSKWGCETAPLAVYTINERRHNTFRCNGPSRQCKTGGCKHVRFVKWAKKNPDRDLYVMVHFEF